MLPYAHLRSSIVLWEPKIYLDDSDRHTGQLVPRDQEKCYFLFYLDDLFICTIILERYG